jgi:hypothetical protein
VTNPFHRGHSKRRHEPCDALLEVESRHRQDGQHPDRAGLGSETQASRWCIGDHGFEGVTEELEKGMWMEWRVLRRHE